MSEEVQKSPDFLPTEDAMSEEVRKSPDFCRLLRSFNEAEESRDL